MACHLTTVHYTWSRHFLHHTLRHFEKVRLDSTAIHCYQSKDWLELAHFLLFHFLPLFLSLVLKFIHSKRKALTTYTVIHRTVRWCILNLSLSLECSVAHSGFSYSSPRRWLRFLPLHSRFTVEWESSFSNFTRDKRLHSVESIDSVNCIASLFTFRAQVALIVVSAS